MPPLTRQRLLARAATGLVAGIALSGCGQDLRGLLPLRQKPPTPISVFVIGGRAEKPDTGLSDTLAPLAAGDPLKDLVGPLVGAVQVAAAGLPA